MQSQFLYNPPDKGLYCHAPTLLKTAAGNLLAAWYAYAEEEHVGASLVIARRLTAEKQWGPSGSVLGVSHYSAGNPVLFQVPSGVIWLLFVLLKGSYWNDAELQGAYSDDEGHTWSAPITLWQERGMMVRHAPVLRADGSLLLPAYDEVAHRSVLLSSREPYSQWTEIYRFTDSPLIQPVLVREASGRLALFFRPSVEPWRIWRSHSNNDGSTWAVPIRTPLPNPLSGIAAFITGDRMAVVYNHTEELQRHPLSIALSADSGITWSEPRHLETIRYEVCYPSFISDCTDRIHGVYTYNRRMIKYVSFAPEWLG